MSDPRTDLPSPTAPNYQARVREVLMTYLGRQGNTLDRGLTVRDLVDVGLIKLKDGYSWGRGSLPIELGDTVGEGTPGPAGPAGPPGADGGSVEPDLTPPPSPTGFAATAGLTHIMVEHDAPTYTAGHGHLRTRLYGAIRALPTDPAPVFGDAIEIAQFYGTFYAFATNPATTWHLWAKWETADGVLSASPAGSTNGVVATTGQDVALLLEILSGQISESELAAALSSRIDLIDGTGTGSVTERIAAETLARTTAISAEQVARQTEDSALAATSTAVTAALGDNLAGVRAESQARADADSAIAVEVDSLAATTGANTSAIQTEALARADADSASASRTDALTAAAGANTAGILAEQSARAGSDASLSEQIGTMSATMGANIAAIQSEASTRATADTASASQITTLQATAGANTASIAAEASTRATETGSLFAQYTVKIDVAGHVSGYGLASTAGTATPTSEFGIRADKFWVAPAATASPTAPTTGLYKGFVWLDTSGGGSGVRKYYTGAGWTTTPQALPFVVQAVPTTINGVAVPAGVYMDAAFIMSGSIVNAMIGNATIEDAKMVSVSVQKLLAGSLAVGQYIQSTGYVAGSAGWRINADGTAEMSNAVIRGTVFASAGLIGGITIGSNYIQTTGYVLGTTGFRLNSDGTGQIGGIYFGGNYLQSSNYVSGSAGFKLNASGALEINSLTARGTVNVGDYTNNNAFPTTGTVDIGGFSDVASVGASIGANGLIMGTYDVEIWCGAMQAGRRYRIKSIGTPFATDFTTLGAASNTVGEVFFATGPGYNNGTVAEERYAFLASSGDFYIPGLSVINGVMTVWQANVINTLNIAGNAVTVPNSAFTAGSVNAAGTATWVDLQTVTLTTTGGRVILMCSCTPTDGTSTGSEGSGGGFFPPTFRLVHGSTELMIGRSPTLNYSHTPAAGSQTYKLQFRDTNINGAAPTTVASAASRFLFAMEIKR